MSRKRPNQVLAASKAAAASRTETSSRATPPGWIISPVWDTFLFIATPLISMAAFLPLRGYFSSEQIAIFLLAFFTFGHHLPGFIRAYGDRELFSRYRWRFLLAPPLIFATTLWFDLRGLHGLIIFVFAWDIWHVLMQHYGFMRIYDAKQGEVTPTTAWLDWAVSISWYVSLIVASPHYRHNLLLHAYTTGIPLVPQNLFVVLEAVLYTTTAGLTLAYLIYNIRLWKQGRLNPRKLVLLGTFLFATHYLYVRLDDFLVGFVVWSAFHCIQYYGIVWAFNVNRVSRGSAVTSWVRFLFRPRILLAFLYVGLILAYGGINYLQSFVWDETSLRLLLAFVFTSNALHYYYDGFIWKVREPETRKYLEKTPAAQMGRDKLAGASATVRQAAQQLNPVNRGWLQAAYLALIILALMAFETWNRPDTVSMSESLLALAPNVGDAHYNLGAALQRNGQLQAAETKYRDALRLMPDAAKAHTNLGAVLADQGRLDEAIEHYRQALNLQRPGSKRKSTDSPLAPLSRAGEAANLFVIHSNLADALARRGDSREAVTHYREALDIDSHAPDLRANLGATLAGLGQREEGIRELQEALKIDPNFFGAHLLLASVFAYMGRADAFSHYHAALQIENQQANADPLQHRARASFAQAHVNVGVAFASLGRYDDAIAAYRRAIEVAPDFPPAHLNLAGVLAHRGQTRLARRHYQFATEGNHPEARRLALAALKDLPEEPP